MDYSFCKLMLSLNILESFLISCVYGQAGVCSKKIRRGNEYVDEQYCCANYEMKNGTCTVCEIGFMSKDGGSCQQCRRDNYGVKCLHTCTCTDHQTCHHILGCIGLPSSSMQTTFKESTDVYSWMTTPNTEKEITERNESNHGLLSFTHYMVIYSVCVAGGLLVLITICFICIRLRRNRRKKQGQESSNQQNEIQNAPSQSLPSQENMARLESIYDEIDDEVSLHHGDSLPIKLIYSSGESISDEMSESEKENMHNEGYLNPYQPIIKESVTHDNNKYDVISKSFDDADRIENKSIVFNSNVNANLEKVEHVHQYIEIIDSRNENSINEYNDGSSSNHQLSKKIQYAEIVNIQHCEHREASQLNIFLSNEEKSNDSKDVRKSSYPVAIKRLTI